MRRVLLVLPLLLLAACDTAGEIAPPVGAQLGEAHILLGTSAVVDGLAVAFEAVEEDSRCPDTAMCVWEGRALVALTIEGEGHALWVVDPEETPESGVRIGDRLVFAVALTRDVEDDSHPVVTVATFEAAER